MAWHSVFNDTYWEPVLLGEPNREWSWNGTHWIVGPLGSYNPEDLIAKGTWYNNYEPTAMRITATFNVTPNFALSFLELWGTNSATYVEAGGVYTLTVLLSNWSNPLSVRFVYTEYDFIDYVTITNIEFESPNSPIGSSESFSYLVKVDGKQVVLENVTRTRQVWVDPPPTYVPPPTVPSPPSNTQTPPSSGTTVPFTGNSVIACTTSSGGPGYRIIYTAPDGTVTYLTACLPSEGLTA